MKTIYTQFLNPTSKRHWVPVFEETVLKGVVMDKGTPALVFEAPVEAWGVPVPDDLIVKTRIFDMVGVNSVIPDNYVYVGTVSSPDGVMWFVYEVCDA